MAQVRRFTFDTCFPDEAPDAAPVAEEVVEPVVIEPLPPPEPTFSAAELAAARAAGYGDGHAAGVKEAMASTERQVAQALAALAERLAAADAALAEIGDARMREAVAVAAAVAAKLTPEIVRDHAVTAIEAFVAECLAQAADEPQIVVRVADPLLDALRARIDPLVAATAFRGKLILIADPSVAVPDCRVEWADGGASTGYARAPQAIDAMVERYLQFAGRPAGDDHLVNTAS